MDRNERIGDMVLAARAAAREQRADIWTAIPATIESYNNNEQTVVAQPTIKGLWRNPQGETEWIQMPLCLDCPIHFPRAGGFSITFPVKKGDEGLLIFSARCIDSWWKNGGIQTQADLRMHNLSDGFFIHGFTSQPKKLDPLPSTETAQFRTDDGKYIVELAADHVKTKAEDSTTLLTKDELTLDIKTKITLKVGSSQVIIEDGKVNIIADKVFTVNTTGTFLGVDSKDEEVLPKVATDDDFATKTFAKVGA